MKCDGCGKKIAEDQIMYEIGCSHSYCSGCVFVTTPQMVQRLEEQANRFQLALPV